MARSKEKSKTFQRPRGTHDILPEDQPLWEHVRSAASAVARFYNFERIDTPHFEDADLFYAGVGRATDIVTKQMYTFRTRGGDQLTLRPEGTASVVRAYVEHGMAAWPQPVKLFYLGSFFRHEAPQRGRFREFHQWGLELIGDESPVADGQVVQVFCVLLAELGLRNIVVEVNSVGCPACRPAYRAQLTQYYRSKVRGLCRDCKERFRENPLRLLDCAEEKCMGVKKGAPQIVDRLCEACRSHLKFLLEIFEEADIPYALNPHLVRGLDYYTRTVFETFLEDAAAESRGATQGSGADQPAAETPAGPKKLALVSGGRYDGLVELVGGKPAPGVGGAMGLERLIAELKERGLGKTPDRHPSVFLVQLGDLAKKKSFRVIEDLRKNSIAVAESLGRDSIRSQLKVADRLGAIYALILGQKEALDEMIILREMSSGIQETVPQSRLAEVIKKKLRR